MNQRVSRLALSLKPLILVSLVALVLFISCESEKAKVVAKIDGNDLLLNDFIPPYRHFLENLHLDDNLASRYQFLSSYIDEHLILDHMGRTGLSEHADLKQQVQIINDQLLLNQYAEFLVFPEISITDEELRRRFLLEKTSLHIRHLFSRDLETILSLEQELSTGTDWNTLAMGCFSDPTLSGNGGDIGWYQLGELDSGFEQVAFALEVGEVSGPVRTANGYSIIQIIEQESDKFITEQDYQLHKKSLEYDLGVVKRRQSLADYVDMLRDGLAISVHEEQIAKLFSDMIEKPLPESGSSGIIVIEYGDNESLNQAEALRLLSQLSDRQWSKMFSPDDLTEALTGKLIQQIMLAEARTYELDKTPLFSEKMKDRVDAARIKFYLDYIYKDIPEDELMNPTDIVNKYHDIRNEMASSYEVSVDSTVIKEFILQDDHI